ncbi:Uncharacterised protein [Achromobacter ruhlandii]|nr:Uncharacterised protein [Achromobacter ruhlandii]CUJ60915.1 Uncharacterised protein [Achromobacter ruhlandii]CUK22863.1 Uncharacterised protein [Achromobacter ruhlandii]
MPLTSRLAAESVLSVILTPMMLRVVPVNRIFPAAASAVMVLPSMVSALPGFSLAGSDPDDPVNVTLPPDVRRLFVKVTPLEPAPPTISVLRFLAIPVMSILPPALSVTSDNSAALPKYVRPSSFVLPAEVISTLPSLSPLVPSWTFPPRLTAPELLLILMACLARSMTFTVRWPLFAWKLTPSLPSMEIVP